MRRWRTSSWPIWANRHNIGSQKNGRWRASERRQCYDLAYLEQHRLTMLALGLVFAALTFFIVQSGFDIHTAYYQVVHGMSVAICVQQNRQDAVCQTLRADFHNTYLDPSSLLLLILLPVLLGMFLAAPLVA